MSDNIELSDIGYLMALTGSTEINEYAITKFQKQFGENGAFRLITSEEMNDKASNPKEGLFSYTDNYFSLTETARKFPEIHEIDLNDKAHYEDLILKTIEDKDIIPLFLKDKKDKIEIISSYNLKFNDISKGWKLI